MKEVKQAFAPMKRGMIRIIVKFSDGSQRVFEGKLTLHSWQSKLFKMEKKKEV